MSYDVWAEIDSGGPEPVAIEPEGGGNYTSNVSTMWTCCLTAALGKVPAAYAWCGADALAFNASGRVVRKKGPDGELEDAAMAVHRNELCLRDLAGGECGQLAPLFTAAIEWGFDHVGALGEMNPDNGWGDADGALRFLQKLQRLCEQNPKAKLAISS